MLTHKLTESCIRQKVWVRHGLIHPVESGVGDAVDTGTIDDRSRLEAKALGRPSADGLGWFRRLSREK